ncbi:hypothetical protein RHMOL_Rhmol08G0275100 [Rhododendron molle]|uniref:Uncharacterized protein n=1 Tax=Rhododendron molle TaxID=49168 RepID=A0ACC0MTT9_RHOML|nr:hypothetical protein RHMOL_Rhmol08G0275100 [Rhododendron molle]
MAKGLIDAICAKSLSKSVIVSEIGSGWLDKSAVGKLTNYKSLASIQDLFLSNGVGEVQIRSMGGLYVLVSFQSKEILEEVLKENDIRNRNRVILKEADSGFVVEAPLDEAYSGRKKTASVVETRKTLGVARGARPDQEAIDGELQLTTNFLRKAKSGHNGERDSNDEKYD